MSWDAVILRIRGPIRPAEELAASDYLPLGSTESVAAAIRSAFPAADWNGSTYAYCALDDDTGIMIELGHVASSHSIHVTVSGSGDLIPSLLALASKNGWVVLDVQTSEFHRPGGSVAGRLARVQVADERDPGRRSGRGITRQCSGPEPRV